MIREIACLKERVVKTDQKGDYKTSSPLTFSNNFFAVEFMYRYQLNNAAVTFDTLKHHIEINSHHIWNQSSTNGAKK